jgi:hypothetical protein
MAATTREDINLNAADSGSMYPQVASNDTELDIEVGKVATEQKRETGSSEDAAAIKARLVGEGFKKNVVKPESVSEDMRLGHEDTLVAQASEKEMEADVKSKEADKAASELSEVKKSSKK